MGTVKEVLFKKVVETLLLLLRVRGLSLLMFYQQGVGSDFPEYGKMFLLIQIRIFHPLPHRKEIFFIPPQRNI